MSVFIIAEAGVNHNGDIELAKKLIDVASDAGVNAVKFQTWKTDLIVTKDAKQAKYQTENTGLESSQYNMLKKLELSYDDFIELKNYCEEKNIIFLSTPDEIESARFLNDLQNIFKIGSGELNNISFLKEIGKFKKKVILSTGMGTLDEIEIALNSLINAGVAKKDIIVLHATSQYPTPMNQVNLKAMNTIKDTFDVNVGYSDHTLGIEVAIAAVAMGAMVIEKHFTLSRNLEGPDHKASLEPSELKHMVQSIRNIELAFGDGEKKPQQCEIETMKVVRKTIVASQIIQKGDKFSNNNLTVKRVGMGIGAERINEIVDTIAQYDFVIDDVIKVDDE